MRRSQNHHNCLSSSYYLGFCDSNDVCSINVWSDHTPLETTLQRIAHTDIKNFINKWGRLEETNWICLDLKIHSAFKALSVGNRRHYYFICFPWKHVSTFLISGINGQHYRQWDKKAPGERNVCLIRFSIQNVRISKKWRTMKPKIKWHLHAESSLVQTLVEKRPRCIYNWFFTFCPFVFTLWNTLHRIKMRTLLSLFYSTAFLPYRSWWTFHQRFVALSFWFCLRLKPTYLSGMEILRACTACNKLLSPQASSASTVQVQLFPCREELQNSEYTLW